MKIGAILQACRERAGLTQEEMAEKLHRSPSCISKMENDKKLPDLFTFVEWGKVTQANEVVIAFLYGMDGLGIMQNIATLFGG